MHGRIRIGFGVGVLITTSSSRRRWCMSVDGVNSFQFSFKISSEASNNLQSPSATYYLKAIESKNCS